MVDHFAPAFTFFPARPGRAAKPAAKPQVPATKARGKPGVQGQPAGGKGGKGVSPRLAAESGQSPVGSSISGGARIFLVPVNNCPAVRGMELMDFLFFNFYGKISADFF